MVNLTELTAFFETIAPRSLAEEYDNVGLLIGRQNKEVSKVLVTLDVDEKVAQEALKKKVDLIFSHHPLIFKPLDRVADGDATQRTVHALIQNDIALYSAHTNFDSVQNGLGDIFLDTIALTKNRVPLEGDAQNGIGRYAELVSPITFDVLLKHIKNAFSLTNLRYVGDENRLIRNVAVVNGSGADFILKAKQMGADCFVTGDIKYHQARLAYENDLPLVEIPHYQAEILFVDYAKQLLEDAFGKKIEILTSKKNIDIFKSLA